MTPPSAAKIEEKVGLKKVHLPFTLLQKGNKHNIHYEMVLELARCIHVTVFLMGMQLPNGRTTSWRTS
jgi:hypothetical protein